MNIDLQAREIQPLRQTFTRVAIRTGDKPASRYLEATLDAQPTANFHYRPTWEPGFDLFDTRRSAVRMADWYALRDPRQYYYATWTMARARQQDTMEANYQFVESRGLVGNLGKRVVVASPLYKNHFDLSDGVCLEAPEHSVRAHSVRVEDGRVLVALG